MSRLAAATAALLLAACSTTLDNAPVNLPARPALPGEARAPVDIVGSHLVALSLSGGGLRAAAFSFGVIEALASVPAGRGDLFDDLTFVSSVSGGSLTAAYVGLEGRKGLANFRRDVLERNLERDLRLSFLSPANLLRLMAGGVNDRSNLARVLDADVFGGRTFADLWSRRRPDVWINATDLYNRTPFPFLAPVFDNGLCSDLGSLRLSEAVAASMAVPLAFAPVVLQTFPDRCRAAVPAWVTAADALHGEAGSGVVAATARAVQSYRDPAQLRFVKLVDGGLTDNQGLASLLVARAVSGTPYGPFSEADAIRLRRMLFLVVDAGRPPSGDWARTREGPSGMDSALAAADAAVDSATRLAGVAFRTMTQAWRDDLVRWRCAQSEASVRRFLPAGERWACDDVRFYVGVVGFDALRTIDAARAARLSAMPTRLSLPAADIEAAISAGRDAALASPALARYRAERLPE